MTGIDHCLPPIQAQRSKAFDKKSRSTNKLTDLGMKLGQLGVAVLFPHAATCVSFSIASRFQAAICVEWTSY